MGNPIDFAQAIIEECKKPVIGDLFKSVLTANLQVSDIYYACGLESESIPDWVRVVAGGNPEMLTAVAQIALEVFLSDALEIDPVEPSKKTDFPDGTSSLTDFNLFLN